jgi:hypothetical protein
MSMNGNEVSENTKARVFNQTDGALCVCVPFYWSMRKVEEYSNQEHPLDNFKRWFVDEDLEFFDGRSNPCACNEEPKARRHWLLVN